MAACHTKANNKKNTGITGNISTKGLNIAYASGNFPNTMTTDILINSYSIQKIYLIECTLKILL